MVFRDNTPSHVEPNIVKVYRAQLGDSKVVVSFTFSMRWPLDCFTPPRAYLPISERPYQRLEGYWLGCVWYCSGAHDAPIIS